MRDSDPARFLSRDGLASGLRQRAMRGALLTMGGEWIRFALTLGSTMILARLLSPVDFGLVAMVTAITAFAERFRDLGLSQATVQHKHLQHEQVSTLFWLNTVFGILLALLLAAAAPAIAAFYGRSELTAVTLVLAGTFVFVGLAVQHQALLVRQMRYLPLQTVDVLALAASVTAGLAAAWNGAGYWALVVAQVVLVTVRCLLLWVACRWRPGKPARLAEVRHLLAYGGNVSATNVLNYFSRNFDNLLIGRVWGASQLGIYSKAYQLLLLPLQQVNRPLSQVALPTLAFLQDEPQRYRAYYRQAISSIAHLSMPTIAVAAALAEDAILIVLGGQWLEAAPIFRVLAFASIVQTVSNTNHWVYLSSGTTARMTRWALISRPLVIVSFLVGLPWGAYGVAISYTIGQLLLLLPGFAFAVKGSHLELRDVSEAAWRPATISVLLYGSATLGSRMVADLPILSRVAATVAVALIVYALLMAVWSTARGEARNTVAMLRDVLTRRSRRSTSE